MFVGMLQANDNKIIYMIASPRTVSTAFLRMMMDHRGDFVIYNEPSSYANNMLHYADQRFRKGSFPTFEDVKQTLFKELETSNVFVKDVSFTTHEFLSNDPEFMSNPDVHFVFLVRDPHATTISSCLPQPNAVVASMTDLIGLEKVYQIFQLANLHSPNPVTLIQSEELCSDPETVVQALRSDPLCQSISIVHPFVKTAFCLLFRRPDSSQVYGFIGPRPEEGVPPPLALPSTPH